MTITNAREMKMARASTKRRLAAQEVTLRQLLVGDGEVVAAEVATMRVVDLLRAQFRWGWDRAARTCATVGMSEGRLVGSLTMREREEILGLVERRRRGGGSVVRRGGG